MKKLSPYLSRTLFLLIVVCMFILPLLSLAQGAGGRNPAAFANPLGNINTVQDLLARVIRWILAISAVITLAALVVGGLKFILALGDENKLKEAKSILFWSIAGLVLIVLAYLIVQMVVIVLGVPGTG